MRYFFKSSFVQKCHYKSIILSFMLLIFSFFILSSCNNANSAKNELLENTDADFVYSDGRHLSTNLADEHHPVMLGNHFYYVADVIATGNSFVYHAKLLPDGTFQDLGRLKNDVSGDLDLKLLGNANTNRCQIGTDIDYWDMHGITMNDGKSFLIFGRRIIAANDGKHGICILPLDQTTGDIDWVNQKLILLPYSPDASSTNCTNPIAVGFAATKLNQLGVFLNYEGLSSTELKFAAIDYSTASGVQTGGMTGGSCSVVKSYPAYVVPPATFYVYQGTDKAFEVRSVTVNSPELTQEVSFQVINNDGKLQLFGTFAGLPLKLDIFDQKYYDCCLINSPSIGPDKRFYFAAEHNSNPDLPTMDLYRIVFPTVDEMKPAQAMIKFLLTGEPPVLDVTLP